jgi:hypothetical protein
MRFINTRSRLFRVQLTPLLPIVSLLATSCSRGPARIEQPGIDPSSSGRLAMEQYDADGDGKVAGAELDKSPPLKTALARLDTDGDEGVSADEVAARVNAWKEMRTGLTSVRTHVNLDGQPLAGALITLEPESFLGDNIKPARGTTNIFGDISPCIAPEDLPDPTLPGGAHFGLYRVRISKLVNGKETLPARYNSETTLGLEVSYDEAGLASGLKFDLKSN